MLMEAKYPSCNPEIWGGIECTINRVNDTFRDQLWEAGHYNRDADIEQIAKLGIRALRYPVLWERHLPDENGNIDWHGTATRLETIRRNNMIPVAGLLHHGSGPVFTNLLDDGFADKLALYAGQVAARFPWLEYYTPVNEPLTTARFSGLYGFWYPHHQNELSFVKMLLQQVKGTILSMKAIRAINPAAKLVQTEDLCKVHSTPLLADQASFENRRRWLTYDLLCGKFNAGHPFWNHFLSLGIPEADLIFFNANACPPDIMGFNYYVTSERYLDDNLENYPPHLQGGNGRQRYADTDAARAGIRHGLVVLLREAWERYGLPLAVTECHLNCTREEQMRWLQETWDACCLLNREGIPVKAVTCWSLLGSFDWDSLLLQHNKHYEPGVFDISAGYLRPTLLAEMIRTLASGQSFNHPLLAGDGWWHIPTNFRQNPVTTPLLIMGDNSPLKDGFETACQERQIFYQAFSWVVSDTHYRQSWGIIITVSKWDDQKSAIYQRIKRRCGERKIPLLVVASAALLPDEPAITTDSRSCLVVQYGNAHGMKCTRQAIDLFIDGEKGNWYID